MSVPKLLGAIVRGIRSDLDRCAALIPLLETQQRLLAAADSERLAEVGATLVVALNELESSARSRSEYLMQLGLAGNGEGMQVLLDKLPPTLGAELAGLWQDLKNGLARCKALNERNGELLASQRMTLSHLTGQALSGYGPD